MSHRGGVQTSLATSVCLQESFLAPVFTKDEQKHRHPYEFEVERDAKTRSLEQFSASHGHPPIVLNGWHGESAIDLSCPSEGSPGATSPFPVSASTPKIGAIGSLQGALGMDLSGILQAGLIHPVTGSCTPVADSCSCMAKPIQYCN